MRWVLPGREDYGKVKVDGLRAFTTWQFRSRNLPTAPVALLLMAANRHPHPAGMWGGKLTYTPGVIVYIRIWRLKGCCRRKTFQLHTCTWGLCKTGEDKAGSYAKPRNAPKEGYKCYHC